jgi:hypothetical protein
MKDRYLKIFLLLAFLEGAGVLFLLFRTPSENPWLLGISAARWGIALAAMLLTLAFATVWLRTTRGVCPLNSKLERILARDKTLFFVLLTLLCLFTFFLGGWLFSYLFIPPPLRWMLAWGALIALQGVVLLCVQYRRRVRSAFSAFRQRSITRWKSLDPLQVGTLRLMALIGALYFAAFIIPNALDAFDSHTLFLKGGDENITYPYVVWMLTPGSSMESAVYRFFIYEDYHYGYPFYFLSMLTLLPVRLIAGADFGQLTQLNLLILRQMISVLPMILSAGILTWLQTRFRSKGKSAALFLLLLLLAGVVQYNTRFWHPDALVVLCVALVIFFLDRDRLRYRHNFLLAAFFCGLASAIKLFGFFFVLSIGGYLLYGLIKKLLTFRRALAAGGAFLTVMFAVLIFSNPFLFFKDARDTAAAIMQEKSSEVTQGYAEPDPQGVYQKGLTATLPHLRKPYGLPFILAFLLLSISVASVYGENRVVNGVLLGWVLASGLYLIFFSAIKNYHYWLPTMLPLFSGFFALPDAARGQPGNGKLAAALSSSALLVERITWLLITFQLIWTCVQAAPVWRDFARITEIFQH